MTLVTLPSAGGLFCALALLSQCFLLPLHHLSRDVQGGLEHSSRAGPTAQSASTSEHRVRSLKAPLSPEMTDPSSTYPSLPKSPACLPAGHHQHHPCSPRNTAGEQRISGHRHFHNLFCFAHHLKAATQSQIFQLPPWSRCHTSGFLCALCLIK